MTRVILLSGVPGSGKTTLAKFLAEMLNIKQFNLRSFIDKNCQAAIENGCRVVDIKELQNKLSATLLGNERLLIETHLTDCMEPKLVEKVIILRINPLVLYTRLKKRHYSTAKILVNLESEILGYCTEIAIHHYGFDKTFEIRADQTLKSCLFACKQIIEKGAASYKPGLILWQDKTIFELLLKLRLSLKST